MLPSLGPKMPAFRILIGLLVSFSSAIHLSDSSCPDGWDGIGTRCYKRLPTFQLGYLDAVSTCESIGGSLFVPNNEDEIAIVSSQYGKRYYFDEAVYMWVGCEYDREEDIFICVDGTKLHLNNSWWYRLDMFVNEPSYRLHITKHETICASYQTFGMMPIECSITSVELVTLCEAGLLSIPYVGIQPMIFTPSTDNKGRALIGYCRNDPDDHVINPSSGQEPACAVACKNIKKIQKKFITNEIHNE
ncbi:uncharacterized protein LOC121412880 [Lytechinus variegatus]|uniref:uncharacterized protein LOC121412880 n=1 Tax=Lytechinus variegatus TaxID=7654 RepID=UPI001BB2BDE3|nr:uncharacterized protein LOC121412880 [Lytechinus variegatus]